MSESVHRTGKSSSILNNIEAPKYDEIITKPEKIEKYRNPKKTVIEPENHIKKFLEMYRDAPRVHIRNKDGFNDCISSNDVDSIVNTIKTVNRSKPVWALPNYNSSNEDYSKKSEIDTLNMIVVDIDGEDHNKVKSNEELRDLLPKVEILKNKEKINPLISCSGNGYHIYIPIPPTPVSEVEDLNKKLEIFSQNLNALVSDVLDVGVTKDYAKPIGVPGTVNNPSKYDRPLQRFFLDINLSTSINELRERNKPLLELIKDIEVDENDFNPSESTEIEEFRDGWKKDLKESLEGLWESGKRNYLTMAISGFGARKGLPKEDVTEIVRYVWNNQDLQKDEWPERKKVIDRAYKKIENGKIKDVAYRSVLKNFAGYEESRTNEIVGNWLDSVKKTESLEEKIQSKIYEAVKEKDRGKLNNSEIAYICRKLILEEHEIINTKDNENLWIYNEDSGLWESDAESKIRSILVNALNDHYTQYVKKETLEQIRGLTTKEREVLGSPREVLPTKNGLIDLGINEDKDLDKLDRLRELKPSDHAITKIPVEYDPGASYEDWKNFLEDVTDESWKIDVLQEFIGYTLFRDQRFEKALMLTGDGSNGKSVFIGVIKELLGEENIHTASLHKIINDTHARADLYGKMANVHADISGKDLTDTGAFKIYTGGDRYVEAERKYENSFKFNNYSKFIFSANDIPRTKYDKSRAFYRRWLVINFPYKYTKDENDGFKDADPKLKEKLTTEKKLSGVLNWAIEGLQRLLEQGRFSYPRTPNQNAELWEKMSNPIKAFTDEVLEEKPDNSIPKDTVYNAYREYAKQKDAVIKAKNVFTKELKKALSTLDTGQKKIGGERTQVYQGIKFKDLSPDQRVQGSSWGKKARNQKSSSSVECIESFPSTTSVPSDRDNYSQKERIDILQDLISNGVEQDELVEKVEDRNLYDSPIKTKLLKDLKVMKENGDIINPKPEYYEVKVD